MGQTTTIDPVEVIKSKASKADSVTAQCRLKLNILKNLFEAMADQSISSKNADSCFLGAMTISEEIIDQLAEVGNALDTVTRNAELCIPDPEKQFKPPVTVEEMLEE